jgi:Ca2+-transporting ATPase
LQGALALLVVASIFIVALRRGMPESEVRALAFFSLVVTIVSLIFVNRSFSASLVTAFRRPNRTLMIVLLVVLTMLAITLAWPFARGLFRFGPLHPDDLTVTLGAGMGVLVVLEGLKLLYARFFRAPRRL